MKVDLFCFIEDMNVELFCFIEDMKVELFCFIEDMKVEFAELLMEISKKQKENPPETEDYLLEAFRTFDVERSGKISLNTLREAMSNHGERLREEEINEMVTVATDARTDDENIINYESKYICI